MLVVVAGFGAEWVHSDIVRENVGRSIINLPRLVRAISGSGLGRLTKETKRLTS